MTPDRQLSLDARLVAMAILKVRDRLAPKHLARSGLEKTIQLQRRDTIQAVIDETVAWLVERGVEHGVPGPVAREIVAPFFHLRVEHVPPAVPAAHPAE